MMSKIKKKIKELPKEYIALIFTSSEDYVILYYDVLEFLLNELNSSGIAVTINKPAKALANHLKDRNIDLSNFYIIDCVSKAVGVQNEVKNCLYVNSPSNLTQLNISIKKQFEKLKNKEKSFLIFDSLSTLLIYNSTGSVLKFINFLTSRMKGLNIGGVFITVEEGLDKNFVSQIIQFCDAVIRT